MKESPQLITQALTLGGEIRQDQSSTHTLFTRLQERRLSLETISTAQIEIASSQGYEGKGWEYPTPSGGTRFKSARDQGAKYYWIPSKPSGEVFYYLDDLPDAIKAAQGACWYTSESDLWALRSAGIYHTLGHYGESSVPDALHLTLQALGVTTLYIAPDLDQAGERWAEKVSQALKGSGIELSCRTLPDTLGEGGDLGRAWETYTKTLDFERWLVNLPSYIPTISEPINEPSFTNYTNTPQYTDGIPSGYKLAIAEALGWQRGKNVSCPYHEHHKNGDAQESASLLDAGLYCHTSGELYLWNDLGKKLGLGSIGAWRRIHERVISQGVQLSTETRETLIKGSFTALARFIDALYSIGWQAGEIFTRPDAEKALDGILSSWAIRKALKQGEGENIDKRESKFTGKYKQAALLENSIKCGKLSLFFLHPSLAPISHNKSKGRPKTYYKLPSKKEISQAFGIIESVEHYDTIELEHIKSAPQYRAEIYAALIRRRPNHYSRRTHKKRMGSSPTTTRRYDKLAQVDVTPRAPEKIEISIGKLSQLPENWNNKKAGFMWLETEDGRKFRANKKGGKKALAHAQELGGKVYRLKRRSSFYKDGRG